MILMLADLMAAIALTGLVLMCLWGIGYGAFVCIRVIIRRAIIREELERKDGRER